MPWKLRLFPVITGLALYCAVVLMVYIRLFMGAKGEVWDVSCKGATCNGCPDGVIEKLPVCIITGSFQVAISMLHVALMVLYPPNPIVHMTIGVVGVGCLIGAGCEVMFLKQEIEKSCDFGVRIFKPVSHALYSVLIGPSCAGVLFGVWPFSLRSSQVVKTAPVTDEEIVVVTMGGGGRDLQVATRKVELPVAERDLGTRLEGLVATLVGAILARQCAVSLATQSDYWEVPFISRIMEVRHRPIPFVSPQKRQIIASIAASVSREEVATPESAVSSLPLPIPLAMDPDLPTFGPNPLSSPTGGPLTGTEGSLKKSRKKSKKEKVKKKHKKHKKNRNEK
eukprot:TRINITY_DN27053_c0_g1_i1.p1 TRINITY_DN27053_c0_g1~~TRINITY_DN27053_c0_g1_i1.p1  ORF type:complete len:346 (+),score=63.29 TRINITY_DN27053_c0_g1_i1:25-1038(+)